MKQATKNIGFCLMIMGTVGILAQMPLTTEVRIENEVLLKTRVDAVLQA
jgi:hypothetical protein